MALYKTPEEDLPEQSFGSKLLEGVTTPITGLLDILDIPGSYTRGLLSGRGLKRTSGRQLLDEWGILEDDGGIDFAGLAAEFIDPLFFMGSVTGLTKAGKAAKQAGNLLERSKALKLRLAKSVDDTSKAVLTKHIDQTESALKKLLNKGTEELEAGDLLKSTRLQQVKAGQRGAAATIPFTKMEAKLPNVLNQGYEMARAAIPFETPQSLKKLGKLFDTSKATMLGKMSQIVNKEIVRKSILADEEWILKTQSLIDGEVTKMANLENITRPEAEGLLGKQVLQVQEAMGKPDEILKLEKSLVDEIWPTKVKEAEAVALAKEEKLIDELAKKHGGLAENIPDELYNKIKQDTQKTLTKKKEAIEKGIKKQLDFMADRKIKFQHVMDTIGFDGSLPKRLATVFHEAGVNNLEMLKNSGVAITGLDDIINYVPHILSKEGQMLFRDSTGFQKLVGKTIRDGIPGFQKKRAIRGRTLEEVNAFIKEKWGIESAFIQDPFQIYRARQIGTQMAINKATTASAAIDLYISDKHTARGLQKLFKKSGIDPYYKGEQVFKEGQSTTAAMAAKRILEDEANDLIPLPVFLREMGMNRVKIRGKEVGWDIHASVSKHTAPIRQALDKAGFKGAAIPRKVFEDIVEGKKIWVDHNRSFWKMWDYTNDLFRANLTGYHPSHIGTNTIGNTWSNLMSLGPIKTAKYTYMAFKQIVKHWGEAGSELWKGEAQGWAKMYHGAGELASKEIDKAGKLVSTAERTFDYNLEKGIVWGTKDPDMAGDYVKFQNANSPSKLIPGSGNIPKQYVRPDGGKIYEYPVNKVSNMLDYNKNLTETQLKQVYDYLGYADLNAGLNKSFKDFKQELLDRSGGQSMRHVKKWLYKKMDYDTSMGYASTVNMLTKHGEKDTFLKRLLDNMGYEGAYKHRDSVGTHQGIGVGTIADEIPVNQTLSKEDQWFKDFYEQDRGGQTYRESVLGQHKKQRFKNPILDKILQSLIDNPATRVGFGINNLSEETAKLAHYMSKRADGETALDAMFSVKRYLFDYGDLTDFEKQVMRRTVLFYTFMRKNLPLSVTETLANRRAYALGKVSTGTLKSEDFVPAYVRDTGSIAIGDDTFVDVKNPFFEPNRFGSQGEGLVRPIERAVGALVPQAKIPFELITGRDVFRGKPIDNRIRRGNIFPAEKLPFTTSFKDKEGKTVTTMNKNILQILRNLPTSRLQQSVEDVFDPEIVLSGSVLGPRTRKIPYDQRKKDALIKALSQKLEGDPRVRKFSDFFSAAQDTPEDTKKLLERLREVRQEG